jgi:ribosomal protein L29
MKNQKAIRLETLNAELRELTKQAAEAKIEGNMFDMAVITDKIEAVRKDIANLTK